MDNNYNDIKGKIIFKKIQDNSTVLELANLLLEGQTLCLDFNDCEKNQAQNVVSFLSGVNYATDGEVITIAKNTFLFGLKEKLRDPAIKNFRKTYGA